MGSGGDLGRNFIKVELHHAAIATGNDLTGPYTLCGQMVLKIQVDLVR